MIEPSVNTEVVHVPSAPCNNDSKLNDHFEPHSPIKQSEQRFLAWRMNCLPTQKQFKIHQLLAKKKKTTSSTPLFRAHESNIRQIE